MKQRSLFKTKVNECIEDIIYTIKQSSSHLNWFNIGCNLTLSTTNYLTKEELNTDLNIEKTHLKENYYKLQKAVSKIKEIVPKSSLEKREYQFIDCIEDFIDGILTTNDLSTIETNTFEDTPGNLIIETNYYLEGTYHLLLEEVKILGI